MDKKYADLVARLREIAARFDMTSTERYEQDSEAFYAATGYLSPGKDVPMAMGGQDETERRAAHEAWIAGRNRSQQQAIQEAADALAALLPLDDPSDRNTAAEHYRQGWQAGHAAADPPALVALVAEWRQAVTAPLVPPPEMDDNAARTLYRRARSDRADAAHKALLAYPLPAAPPVTDTPQGWSPREDAPEDAR